MIRLKIGLMVCCGFALLACGSEDAKTPEIPETPRIDGAPEAPVSILTPSDIDKFSIVLARFVELELGEPMPVSVGKIKDYLAANDNSYGVSGNMMPDGNGLYSFSGLTDNLKDDSVKAEEILAVFSDTGSGTPQLIDYGMRLKCRRGANPDEWTTELCP